MGDDPQSLLHPVRCPVCGRPGRELAACPWCGERAPLAPRTRGDLARIAAGLALLVVAAGTAAATGADGNPVAPGVPAGMASALAGLLSGFFLVRLPPSSERGDAPEGRCGALRAATAALVASLFSLAFRACAVPYPIPGAARLAWLLPALAAAAFALRVPAEAPNAPASGATARTRAWRRHAPDLVAAALLLPFALAFAAGAPAGLSLVGLALVLGSLLARLASPTIPLLLSAAAFAILLPDPAFLAFGMLARTLCCSLGPHGCGRRGGVPTPPRRAGMPD